MEKSARGRQMDTNTSADNTAQPGRPGLDELVPSRYALRVGDRDEHQIAFVQRWHELAPDAPCDNEGTL